jgi:hypothetical protein
MVPHVQNAAEVRTIDGFFPGTPQMMGERIGPIYT